MVVASVATPWGDGFFNVIIERRDIKNKYALDIIRSMIILEAYKTSDCELPDEDEVQVVIINIIKLPI